MNYEVVLQLGSVFKNTDLKNQTFPSQWVYETGEFDQSVSNGENQISESLVHFDMNLGVAWSKKFGKRTRADIVASPSFISIARKTPISPPTRSGCRPGRYFMWMLMYVLAISVSNRRLIMMWTTMSQNLIVGSNCEISFQKIDGAQRVYLGVMYRTRFGANQDAAAPVIGMGINRFDIGFSYDVNVSDLSAYSDTKTTFEISLVYTAPMFSPKTLSIPCDRY
jgi:hypothetical protein